MLGLLLLAACSDNEGRLRYSYLRSAPPPSVDTVPADTLCADPGPNFRSDGFDPRETCLKTQKFILKYERPDDTVGFKGYRVYLDTTHGNMTWKTAQTRDQEAVLLINDVSQAQAGLVFFFYDRNKPPPGILPSEGQQDTVKPGSPRIYGLDTNGRLDTTRQAFVFAVATRHGSGTQGQPQYTLIVTGDRFPPAIFQPDLKVGAKDLALAWARPNDPTNYFDPRQDTGRIAGYQLTLRLSGRVTRERSDRFKPTLKWRRGGIDLSASVRDSVLRDKELTIGHRYFLPDSLRAHRGALSAADSLQVSISGLIPREALDLVIFAIDSAGNDNAGSMPNDATVILTDSTRPTAPSLEVIDSLTTRNAFIFRWTASRDSVDQDGNGSVEAGPRDNFNIKEYRVSRTLVRGPLETATPEDVQDSAYAVTPQNADSAAFRDSVRFLPPGRTYRISIVAVDSSGFLSDPDTVTVTTDSILFAGADSGLACPPGFVPMPTSRFRLGESSGGDRDESPSKVLQMNAFCIEPFEHRDSLGRFMNKVTWQEADAICKAISPADETQLCSEMEWERACEGFDLARPHLHGIQSETDAGILQTSCNQATNDTAMAMSYELRNPICLTNEGVYDMAGNLSEWVRDEYDSSAYAGLEKDSIIEFGRTFPSKRGDSLHSIRGGNLLKPPPKMSLPQIQALARCSNRDFPMQERPLSRSDCRGEVPMVAVTYAGGMHGFACFELPEPLRSSAISDLMVHKDSTKVLVFFSDDPRRVETLDITPTDSAFRGKRPTAVGLTPLSLAEVVFEKVGDPSRTIKDTLFASELRDTSQAVLRKVLERESPSRAWAPRQEDGRIVVRKFYAHVLSGSKVAGPNYASRNVGFRCCSKPRPKTPAMAGTP